MLSCEKCKKTDSKDCTECDALIDGGALRKKLEYQRKVILETCDGQKIAGELLVVSPVGLGIRVNLSYSEYYFIHLEEVLKVKIRRIANRGKGNCHGFDIIEVYRDGEISGRLNNDEYKALTMPNEKLINKVTEALPDNIKGIVRERISAEFEKAKILDALQVGQAFKYQKGNLKPLESGKGNFNIPMNALQAIADKCRRLGAPAREIFLDKDKIYDVHGIPFDYDSGGLLVLDVTSLIQKERELKKKEMRIYRDVIEAVTGGKLLLIEREQIALYTSIGETVMNMGFTKPEDLDPVRVKVEQILTQQGIPSKEVLTFLVCISEALTNALKHAAGGICRVRAIPNGFRIEVSDKGPGINFTDLPKATLMKNFSTKKSLGCGFTIMLKYVNRLILATGPEGTTLIMEKTDFSKVVPVYESTGFNTGKVI